MKTPVDIITSPEMKAIHDKYLAVQEKNKQAAYNLFTLSSYNNQKENFHSDVIASLLSPVGKHNEGNKFLLLFIDFLNTHYGYSLKHEDYEKAIVTKEEERIDIWIRDEESKHCIIIESKINNADDRVGQIVDYYKRAKNRKFEVDAAIYLTPDEIKPVPLVPQEIEQVLRKVSALSDSDKDLVNGWLSKCCDKNNKPESYTLIYQYIELIKQLNHTAMNNDSMKEFYELISPKENFNVARSINMLSSNLRTYRRDEFMKRWEGVDILPFTKKTQLRQYDNCGMLFENFTEGDFTYKMDIYFINEGNAMLRFWTPGQNDESGRMACFNKLESIEMAKGFKTENPDAQNSWVTKYFMLSKYGSMIELDNILYDFTLTLIDKLK